MKTARARLALALVPALVTLVVVSLAFATERLLVQDNDRVDHTRQVIEQSTTLLVHELGAELRQRAYIITGDSAFLASRHGHREDAVRLLAELRRLTADNPRQRPTLDSLARELPVGFGIFEREAALGREGQLYPRAHRALLRESQEHTDRIRALVGAINAEEQRRLAERQAATARQTRLVTAVLVLGGALAVVVAILVNLLLTRIINERERMSGELVAQLDELVAARRELDARATNER